MAREDPAAFTLLWRHAAREPQFAAYASELRAISVDVVRQLTGLDSGDALLDAWRAEALFGWLVEATAHLARTGRRPARRGVRASRPRPGCAPCATRSR